MFIMIIMFGLSLWLKLNNNFYQIQPGKRSYMAPTLVVFILRWPTFFTASIITYNFIILIVHLANSSDESETGLIKQVLELRAPFPGRQ